jgi:predicted ATPase/DNA-binding SARP family transcriptional activator
MSVHVRLLGGFEVVVDSDEAPAKWRLQKAKTLIKLLALAPGRRKHRDMLVDALWPDLDREAALNNFHQALHAARKMIGASRLVARDQVVILGPDGDVDVDVEAFVSAATTALRTTAVADLAAARELWTGRLLPEDEYEDWAADDRRRLDELHVELLLGLATALLDAGQPAEALDPLDELQTFAPLDERACRLRLAALAGRGRRRDAEAAYVRLRDLLEEELGVAPEPATTAAYRRLFGPTRPAMQAPNNLSASATNFVGRRRDLRELARGFERSRLTTLTGPGGSGKTRLAIEYARDRAASADQKDGVWFIELADVSQTEEVASAIATVLGLTLTESPWLPALARQLADRHLLLVLDNCEHLLDAVGALVSGLLAGTRELTILTTSREPLGLPGELIWRVASLELPEEAAAPDLAGFADVESVQLFVERARDVMPTFRLDESTAPAIGRICRRLDGMPLALELAAARVAHLSVAEIADRLGDAMSLLAGRRGVHIDRQQTLEATLAWSHGLLTDDERVAFRRLSVFAGGFDLDSAGALIAEGDAVSVLSRLVDKSLVVADTAAQSARYRLLEVVRQYAAARLAESGESADCAERHRRWFAEQAVARDPDLQGAVVGEPASWFDVEQDNLRAAFADALKHDPSSALQLAVSTWRFWLSRGQLAVAHDGLTAALDVATGDTELVARALFALGVLNGRRGRLDAAVLTGQRAVELQRGAGDADATARAWFDSAVFLFMNGDWAAEARARQQCRAAADGSSRWGANLAHLEGVAALGVGDIQTGRTALSAAATALHDVDDAAAPFFVPVMLSCTVDFRGEIPYVIGEDSLLVGRRVGAEQARGWVAISTAVADRLGGDTAAALDELDDATERFERLEDRYGLAYALAQRGHTLRWAGDAEAAIESFELAETLRRDLRDHRAVAMTVSGRAVAEAMLGRTSAREIVAAATEAMARAGDVPGEAMTRLNHVATEILLGDLEAATRAARHTVALADRTAPGTPAGWVHATLAALLERTRPGGVAVGETAGRAAAYFERFGDRRGLEWLQRVRKGPSATMPQ